MQLSSVLITAPIQGSVNNPGAPGAFLLKVEHGHDGEVVSAAADKNFNWNSISGICNDFWAQSDSQGNVLAMVQDIADCLVWAKENGTRFNLDKVGVLSKNLRNYSKYMIKKMFEHSILCNPSIRKHVL